MERIPVDSLREKVAKLQFARFFVHVIPQMQHEVLETPSAFASFKKFRKCSDLAYCELDQHVRRNTEACSD
jgi:hypothetical protein